MATDSRDPDDELLALLGSVLDASEAPSASAVDGAMELFALRQMDGELIQLLADSAESAVAQRGVDTARLLRFEGSGCRVEIDAHFGDGMITGQLTPGGVSVVTTITTSSSTTTMTDELGRFRLPIGQGGDRRWRVQFDDGRVIVTPTVRL
jgi:hypothetical protein